jgi:para-nitrobenzyl esterase
MRFLVLGAAVAMLTSPAFAQTSPDGPVPAASGTATAGASTSDTGTATAGAATAARPYTSDATPLGALLDDPAAKAILEAYIPRLVDNDRVTMARGLTLKAIQGYAPDYLTDTALAQIDVELAKLPPK